MDCLIVRSNPVCMEQDELAFARSIVATKPPLKLAYGNEKGAQKRSPRKRWGQLKDGLYRVTTHPRNGKPPICAGFVVKENRIVRCAPILRMRIHTWVHRAE